MERPRCKCGCYIRQCHKCGTMPAINADVAAARAELNEVQVAVAFERENLASLKRAVDLVFVEYTDLVTKRDAAKKEAA